MHNLPPNLGTPLAPVTAQPPKIIAQTPTERGAVEVTYALPGLARAVVSVPEGRWLAGGHAPIQRALGPLLARLGLSSAAAADSVPGAGSNEGGRGPAESEG